MSPGESTEPQAIQFEDPFHVPEQHLDFLPIFT
jgi:hypothetical protein